jgi:hypothetical protein
LISPERTTTHRTHTRSWATALRWCVSELTVCAYIHGLSARTTDVKALTDPLNSHLLIVRRRDGSCGSAQSHSQSGCLGRKAGLSRGRTVLTPRGAPPECRRQQKQWQQATKAAAASLVVLLQHHRDYSY